MLRDQNNSWGAPLVSVVVPVYNVKNYVKACVFSLVGQTYPNLEIILIDDGSTDGSGAECDVLAELDPRIIVFHKSNGGLSDARNFGIYHARGNFISLVDSDDIVAPTYIDRLMLPFEDSEQIDISVCSYELFSRDEEVENINCGESGYELISSVKALEMLCEPVRSTQLEIACAKIFKITLFDNIEFPVGKVHEDTATTYKLYYAARCVAISQEKLYLYRQRNDSITADFKPSNMDMITNLMERDLFYHARLSGNLAEEHTVFALNAIMRLYYLASGTSYENAILQSYKNLYQHSNGASAWITRLRLYIQYRFPMLCRAAYRAKEALQ